MTLPISRPQLPDECEHCGDPVICDACQWHLRQELEKYIVKLEYLAEIGAALEGRKFPIQGNSDIKNPEPYGWVPWEIGMRAYSVWNRNNYRLESEEYKNGKGIADRGGFGHNEMDLYTGSKDWRKYFRSSR